MTNLEIAGKLREQIKVEWPYVFTILALHTSINNDDGKFNERIQSMVNKLLPDEVFYHPKGKRLGNRHVPLGTIIDDMPIIVGIKSTEEYGYFNSEESILSLPTNQVLFSSEDNPLGILK